MSANKEIVLDNDTYRTLSRVIREVTDERRRQEKLKAEGKFDYSCSDPELSDPQKLAILAEEFGEAAKEVTEMVISDTKNWPAECPEMVLTHQERVRKRRKALLRKELIEVAAVAVAWVECLTRELEE